MLKRFLVFFVTFLAALSTPCSAAESDKALNLSPDISQLILEQNKQLGYISEKLQSVATNLEDDDLKKKRDRDDLDAQQEMAFWAKWMFYTSCIGSVVAITSVWLLRNTLQQNSETIRISNKSLVHSENSSSFQLRAYVGIDTSESWKEIFTKPNPFIEFKLKNYGATPARDLGIIKGTRIVDFGTDENYIYTHPLPDAKLAHILMPTSERNLVDVFPTAMGYLIKQVKERKSKILIDAEIKYKDIFDIEHKTTYRFVIYHSAEGEVRGHLSDYGNSAT